MKTVVGETFSEHGEIGVRVSNTGRGPMRRPDIRMIRRN